MPTADKKPAKQSNADLGDTVIFTEEAKHGIHRFFKGSIAKFEDPDAAPYFVRAGWAEFTTAEPQVVFTQGEVDIDPDTIMGNGGPDGTQGLKVQDIVINGSEISGA